MKCCWHSLRNISFLTCTLAPHAAGRAPCLYGKLTANLVNNLTRRRRGQYITETALISNAKVSIGPDNCDVDDDTTLCCA